MADRKRAALERDYQLQLRGDSQDWVLELDPKRSELRRFVSRISISGRAGKIRSYEIEQADGDRSVTWIEPINP